MFHDIIIESCILNYDFNTRALHLEPKLDYRLVLTRLSVQYASISDVNGQNTPLFFRTNISEESSNIGDNIGVEMYWSFDEPNPNPEQCHGCIRLGKF